MRVEIREVGSDCSEKRTYDDDGKLIEIRKIFDPHKFVQGRGSVKRQKNGDSSSIDN